jgi:putative PIN family toxin of toxin-antitoxin system
MLRAVLDTNVYISAIMFGGKPEIIRRLAKEGKIQVLISEAIILEIAEVLRRKFDWESRDILQIIDDIRESTVLAIPRQNINLIKEDDADNRVLECALEGEAQYVVSGDKRHLLPLEIYRGVRILTPDQFLRLL